MEDLVAEEVTPSDPPGSAQLQRKENEYPLKTETNNTLECQEMRISDESNYSPSSRQEFLEMFASQGAGRSMNHASELEYPYNSLGFMDDGGFMAEELTARNNSNSKLAIDTPNNKGRMQTGQNSWQHSNQLANGSGSGSSRFNTAFRDNGHEMSNGLDNGGSTSFPGFFAQRAPRDNRYEAVEELTNTESSGVRTKSLSRSGFSEFFIRNTLKGKGVIYKGPYHESCPVESRNPSTTKAANIFMGASGPILSRDANIAMPSANGMNAGMRPSGSGNDENSLREWLKIGRPKAKKVESLCIFRQIVDLVDQYHSQGLALHELRPSFFKLLPSNQVKYVGLLGQEGMVESSKDQDVSHLQYGSIRKKQVEHGFSFAGLCAKKQKTSQNTKVQWPQFHSTSYNISRLQNNRDAFGEHNLGTNYVTHTRSSNPNMHNADHHLASISEQEEKWYISPEEFSEGTCTALSNIYNLGVLLFELLAHFDSNSALDAAMSNLRHRILPPNFLSENGKEAGFCLWLLHPEPSSRPTTREILQSEVVSGLQEVCAEEVLSSVDQDDAESELLLHFLTSLEEQKQKAATKLTETIQLLEADVEEVGRRYCSKKPLIDQGLCYESLNGRKNTFISKEDSRLEVLSPLSIVSSSNESRLKRNIDQLLVASSNESRLKRNIDQLESAYFLMRSSIQFPETDSTLRMDNDLLRDRKNWCVETKDEEKGTATDRLGAIFHGLCRYARYSKFEVRGVSRNGDFNCSSNSNMICSLSFDRDQDYFAAAGVAKKIKIFEFNAFFDDSVDIHYPAIEMSNKSKISCVCWNNYIKNYLASTDYDGAVKLWDASTGQEFAQYTEHQRRAWSVDFSQVYPTQFASGSDDGSVKLWSINERNSLGTVQNMKANVCCVQFSPHSSHLLAFGSADYRTYCYDLRNTRIPWCVLAGHEKAVSHVKFLDSETIVSAATDNTLKLWDLNKSSLSGSSTNACSLTLGGHTNEKNFVGLSVSDGYIACGSETNEVYSYYRSLPMPIASHKFGSIDPISGKETDDAKEVFVSSVCWRGKSDMVVAANSSGSLKVLQIV